MAPSLLLKITPDGLAEYSAGQALTTWGDESSNARIVNAVAPSATVVVRKAGVNGYDYVEIGGDDNGNDHLAVNEELNYSAGSHAAVLVVRIGDITNGLWSSNSEPFVDFNDAGEETYINISPISGDRLDFAVGVTGTPADMTVNAFNIETEVLNIWTILVLDLDVSLGKLSGFISSLVPKGTDTEAGFAADDYSDGTLPAIGWTSIMDVAEVRIYDGSIIGNGMDAIMKELALKYNIAVQGIVTTIQSIEFLEEDIIKPEFADEQFFGYV